jgi:hypothetical protein
LRLTEKYLNNMHGAEATQEDALEAQTAIRQWCDRDGRKLGWLAAQIPAAQASLSRWLKGKSMPAPIYRNRLADLTGIDMVRHEGNWIKPGDLA